jgi:uncharacterized protein YegL
MPLIAQNVDMETRNIAGSNFDFSGMRIDDLGAPEYTLVTIAVDVTGSTYGFADDLRNSLVTAVEACQKSPRSENLLVRVVLFSTSVGVQELHGFTELSGLNPTDYPALTPGGMTPLYDAAYSSVGAMVDYGGDLMDNDFLANGIVFLITDGGDNASSATPKMIADAINKARNDEKLESLVTVLVGINAGEYQHELDTFKDEAELDQYIDAGEATKGKLAKLADFVSQSVSSTSQALGTGGPSQNISATI